MAELIQTEKAYVRDLRECMDVSFVYFTNLWRQDSIHCFLFSFWFQQLSMIGLES